MKTHIKLISLLGLLVLTGCGTVDATYQSTKGIGQAAIGGVGNVVGNGASDVSKSLGVVSDTAGKVLSGGGKVIGGGLELVGGVVKGTSDVIAPTPAK